MLPDSGTLACKLRQGRIPTLHRCLATVTRSFTDASLVHTLLPTIARSQARNPSGGRAHNRKASLCIWKSRGLLSRSWPPSVASQRTHWHMHYQGKLWRQGHKQHCNNHLRKTTRCRFGQDSPQPPAPLDDIQMLKRQNRPAASIQVLASISSRMSRPTTPAFLNWLPLVPMAM